MTFASGEDSVTLYSRPRLSRILPSSIEGVASTLRAAGRGASPEARIMPLARSATVMHTTLTAGSTVAPRSVTLISSRTLTGSPSRCAARAGAGLAAGSEEGLGDGVAAGVAERANSSVTTKIMDSLFQDLLDDGPRPFEGHALHVEREAAQAAQLLATAGPPGTAVDEHGQDGTGSGRSLRDLGTAEEDAAVVRSDSEHDLGREGGGL